MRTIKIKTPLDDSSVEKLRAGDQVLISGVIFTARDAAHKRMIEALNNNEKLPVELRNQIIYYMGPAPARPGQVIGSAGPTTSGRMDIYTTRLLGQGVKGMIGKGNRNRAVKKAIVMNIAVYFAAVGGAGALISKSIRKAEVVAYGDLGAEAIMRLEVTDFPAIVVNDLYGSDLYQEGKAKYRKSD